VCPRVTQPARVERHYVGATQIGRPFVGAKPQGHSSQVTWAQLELVQDHRVPPLKDLWIRDARVGHVGVHATAWRGRGGAKGSSEAN